MILLWGYYGNRNFGDDALGECLLREIRALVPAADIGVTVPSNASEDWLAPDLRAQTRVVRKDMGTFIHLPSIASTVIFGGGTWYQDYGNVRYKAHALLHALALAQMRLRGRTIGYLGGSLGPFASQVTALLAKACLRLAHDVWFRDSGSARLLGCSANDDVVFDPLVLLPDWVPRMKMERTDKVLGVSAMLFHSMAYGLSERDRKVLTNMAVALSAFLETRPDWSLRLFAFQTGSYPADDRAACEAVKNQLRNDARVDIVEYKGVEQFSHELSQCDAIVAFRLHSAIFAFAYGIPYISIEYHPKVIGFNSRVGLQDQYRIRLEFSPDELECALNELTSKAYRPPAIDPELARRVTRERLRRTLARVGIAEQA